MSESPSSSPSRTRLALHWQIFIAMILAVLLTLAFQGLSSPRPLEVFISITDIVGGLFIKLLKMIIMPLILASVVMSIASLDNIRKLRSLGLKTIAFYMFTTLSSVVVGIVLVNIVNPGEGMNLESAAPPTKEAGSIKDLIFAMVPDNVFAAFSSNSSILSVIVFGVLLALAMSFADEKGAPLRKFFASLNDVMMLLTDWIIRLAPIGVFALLCSVVAKTDPANFTQLVAYMGTVIGGLAIHGLITLPLLYLLLTRKNPLNFVKAMSPALLTAFSTASSSGTLPLTLKNIEERAHVSPRVAGFVLPLGATVNMDGTALYEAVAAIFIAQAFGIDLSFGQQLLIVITATLAAVGAAGVPSAGLVTMLIVLDAVGLPKEGYGLIVAVDRILDMCRTTVNVWGDACGAAIVAHHEGDDLPDPAPES